MPFWQREQCQEAQKSYLPVRALISIKVPANIVTTILTNYTELFH